MFCGAVSDGLYFIGNEESKSVEATPSEQGGDRVEQGRAEGDREGLCRTGRGRVG